MTIIDEVVPYTDILERHTLEQYLGVFEMAHAAALEDVRLPKLEEGWMWLRSMDAPPILKRCA